MNFKFLIITIGVVFFSISSKAQLTVTVNPDTSICIGGTAIINSTMFGGIPPYTYSWTPIENINSTNTSNSEVTPSKTTNYTLIITDSAGTTASDFITVFVIKYPNITLESVIGLKKDSSITLDASNTVDAGIFEWEPNDITIIDANTATPTVNPIDTTLYTLTAYDGTRTCSSTTTIRVDVNEDIDVIIYNTFTPNNDGENDTFYINNLEFFPDNNLEIYNRLGKLVYKKFRYENTWVGEITNNKLPAGTYFYILDLGNGKAPLMGDVTIILNTRK
jgi:gliding motility-associated-like protein